MQFIKKIENSDEIKVKFEWKNISLLKLIASVVTQFGILVKLNDRNLGCETKNFFWNSFGILFIIFRLLTCIISHSILKQYITRKWYSVRKLFSMGY